MNTLANMPYSATDNVAFKGWKQIKEIFLSVTNEFSYTSEFNTKLECLDESDLSIAAMHLSEKSLISVWESEDDAKWDKFLQD